MGSVETPHLTLPVFAAAVEDARPVPEHVRPLMLFSATLPVPSSVIDPFLSSSELLTVSVLVDSGAACTFVSETLVSRLGYTPTPHARPVTVHYADGRTSTSPGTIKLCPVINGVPIEITATVGPIATADILLGLDWHQDYGVQINYKTMVVWFPDGTFWLPQKHLKVHNMSLVDITPSDNHVPVRPLSEVLMSVEELRSEVKQLGYLQCLRLSVPVSDPQSVPVSLNEIGAGFSPDEMARYNAILDASKVFEERTPSYPPPRSVLHRIQLKEGALPTHSPMYRMGPAELLELKQILVALLEAGLIEPSNSPFSAGVLLVPKPNGKWRLVTDYRKLNDITVKSKYPLPRIDDIFNRVQGSTCFTVLDCADGFWQLRIAPEDCHKTAFATPFGHYQFRVAAMGLCNSPASFQMLMNDILRPVMGTSLLPQVSSDLQDPSVVSSSPAMEPHDRACALAYLDDILIFSDDFEQHLRDLAKVLAIMAASQLWARRAKVRAGRSVPFLGHILSDKGVATDPDKTKSIQDWPVPIDVKGIRSFLGICSYYRRFIPRFATIAACINHLLKKDIPFVWSSECQQSFEQLKALLLTSPVLVLPNPSLPFTIATDASKVAIGGVLLQDHGSGLQPVEYISRTMLPAERNYPVHQQELLAVVYCCHAWQHFLKGADFEVALNLPSDSDPYRLTIQTDHRPLTHLLSQPNLTPRQARWMEFLAQFAPFRVQYVKGVDNVVPDALSRRPDYAFFEDIDVLNTTVVPLPSSFQGVPLYGAPSLTDNYQYLFHTSVRLPDLMSHTGLSSQCEGTLPFSVGGEDSFKNSVCVPLCYVSPRNGETSVPKPEPVGPPLLFSKAAATVFKPKVDTSIATPDSDLERLISRFTVTEPEALTAIETKVMNSFPCKFQEGFLYVQLTPGTWRLYVPPLCRPALMYELHDAALGAHRGGQRLEDTLVRSYYWPGLREDVREYVRSCQLCQIGKPSNVAQRATPHTLPDPLHPWDSIVMDFVGPFRKSPTGNDQILVFLDRLTRRCHLVPCSTRITARDCALLYLQNVFRYHGLSRQFISDRDKLFTSDFWLEFFQALGTKVSLGTAYHSSSSHLVERLNRVIEEALRHYVKSDGSDWEEYLCLIEFSLNNSPQATHGYTPFFLDTGRHPLTPTDLLTSPLLSDQAVARDTIQGVKALLERMQKAHESAVHGYRKAQARYMARLRASLDRRTPSIQVGDLVLVEGPRIGRFATKIESELKVKLRPAFLGPFKVLASVDDVVYKVAIPSTWKVPNNMFHRSQLYHQSSFAGRELPPAPLEYNPETGEVEDEVEAIVAHKTVKRGRGSQLLYKVKWLYLRSEHEHEWYPEGDLDGCARLLGEYKRAHGL
mgnify:FL=1